MSFADELQNIFISEDEIPQHFILPEETKNLPKLSNVSILIGNEPNKPLKTLTVSQIIVHPHWTSSDGGFEKGTDLALVKYELN